MPDVYMKRLSNIKTTVKIELKNIIKQETYQEGKLRETEYKYNLYIENSKIGTYKTKANSLTSLKDTIRSKIESSLRKEMKNKINL